MEEFKKKMIRRDNELCNCLSDDVYKTHFSHTLADSCDELDLFLKFQTFIEEIFSLNGNVL